MNIVADSTEREVVVVRFVKFYCTEGYVVDKDWCCKMLDGVCGHPSESI
jgi:hypothetical protein